MFYLFSLGIGLGMLIENVETSSGMEVSYAAFIAPALLAVSAMNGAIYMADLLAGQKTGLFYDQRPNHAFAARLARGARVLDMFSHVGGFALACLAGGAASALAVDGAQAALDLAAEGAARGGVASDP